MWILYFITDLALLLFSLFAIYMLVASRFMLYPPFVVSSGETRDAIVRRVSKRIKKCEEADFVKPFKVIDAGCGAGTLLVPLAKEFPEHNFVGIEWSYLPYWIAKFRARKLKNLEIVRQDMFKYNFKGTNIVICFLIKHLMKRFSEKCRKELDKKSYIFSNRFEMDGFEEIEEMNFDDNYSYMHMYKFLPADGIGVDLKKMKKIKKRA